MREKEFSSTGREFAPTGAEFGPTGREFSRFGPEQAVLTEEFEQKGGGAPEGKRKRRASPLMLTAAAVVTAAVVLGGAGQTAFPQPENFSGVYQEYVDGIMAACETEDETALHQLAASYTATEFWQQCMEPYYQMLEEQGYDGLVYYDGEQMVYEPGPGPALCFWHEEWTQEEMLELSLVGMRVTTVQYFQDGSQIEQGGAGAYYTSAYDGYYFDSQGAKITIAPAVRCFFGTFSGREHDLSLTLIEGVYREYNASGYIGDTDRTMRLERALEGTFVSGAGGTNSAYLENGTLRMYFGENGVTELSVRDGVLLPNPSVEIEWSGEDSYTITIYSPDGERESGTGGQKVSSRLEDHLYHAPQTLVYD